LVGGRGKNVEHTERLCYSIAAVNAQLISSWEGGDMARICEICSKAPVFGHNISHAHNVTNRRWTPNIQRVKVRYEGKVRRIRICTRCLRSGKVEKVI
jgi:large subunit ribosomal protein L28